MSSRCAERGLLLAGVLLAFSPGCAPEEETYRTPLVAAVPDFTGDRLINACLGTDGVDTFVLDIFSYDGDVTPPSRGFACSRCAVGAADCQRLARICRCSDRRTSTGDLQGAFEGVVFDDLPPNAQLCARMTLLDRGAGGASGSGAAAECPPDLACDDLDLTSTGQLGLCSLSSLGALSESETPIVIQEFHCGAQPDLDLCTDLGVIVDRIQRDLRLGRDPLEISCENAERECPPSPVGVLEQAWCFYRDHCCVEPEDRRIDARMCASF